jgi:hypothetical protein
MEPKRRGIEAFLVRLAYTTNATQVTDEFECGEGVVSPGFLNPLDGLFRWRARNYMEKEIQARVSRCRVGQGGVLGEAQGGLFFVG